MNGELVKGWSQANCSVDLPMLSATIPDRWEKEICNEYYDDINYNSSANVIILAAMTVDIKHAFNIMKSFKSQGKKVIFGGHQDSFSPGILSNVSDSYYIGTPSKEQMNSLLSDALHDTLRKVYNFGINIDFPFDYSFYKRKKVRYIQILSSLGCIYNCDYCWHQLSYGGGVKLRNIDHVLSDLNALKGITRYFAFRDPNFYNKRSHTLELCDNIKNENFNFRWGAQCPIIIGRDDELLDKMFQAGCRLLFIGFESLDNKNLKSVNKPFDANQYKSLALNIRRHGINVAGYFMFGFDFDKNDSYDKVYQFIHEAKISLPVLNILTPVPGTKLFERMMDEKRIDYPDASTYLDSDFIYSIPCNKCYFTHPTMSKSAIENNFIKLHKRLTTYPEIIGRTIKMNSESFMLFKMNLDLRKDRKKMELAIH